MRLSDYDYDLPSDRIAQSFLPDRADSRLLVLGRGDGTIRHGRFPEIVDELNPPDLVVINETRVFSGRFFGIKADTRGRVEILLLRRREEGWDALIRGSVRTGSLLVIEPGPDGLAAEVIQRLDDGSHFIRFTGPTDEGLLLERLERLGTVPLPPYVRRPAGPEDKTRYQTVYATESGSVAAPTAGLHFTESILERISNRGIGLARVTLHIGLGTFRPVVCDDIRDHRMHAEPYRIPERTAAVIASAKKAGGRIVAVGTSTLRVLESAVGPGGGVVAGSGETSLFVYPGFRFRVVDALLTNFHMPKSTLILLAAAFAGREAILGAYRQAVDEGYRFLSYGDAMFIR